MQWWLGGPPPTSLPFRLWRGRRPGHSGHDTCNTWLADPEIVRFQGSAFTIFELIRVGGHDGTVLDKTDHARRIP
jgi:hypothetical protein